MDVCVRKAKIMQLKRVYMQCNATKETGPKGRSAGVCCGIKSKIPRNRNVGQPIKPNVSELLAVVSGFPKQPALRSRQFRFGLCSKNSRVCRRPAH